MLIYFPTQYNKFYEVEDKGVVHALSRYIESRQIILVSIDNIDNESLSNFSYSDKRKRLERQESYYNYFLHEFLSAVHNDLEFYGLPYLLGMSFGAFQAICFFLRTPYLFDGVIFFWFI